MLLHLLCVCACTHVQKHACGGVRGQLAEVPGNQSSLQACQQSPLPTEPSCPSVMNLLKGEHLERRLSGQSTCYSSMRIRIQISRIQGNAGWAGTAACPQSQHSTGRLGGSLKQARLAKSASSGFR